MGNLIGYVHFTKPNTQVKTFTFYVISDDLYNELKLCFTENKFIIEYDNEVYTDVNGEQLYFKFADNKWYTEFVENSQLKKYIGQIILNYDFSQGEIEFYNRKYAATALITRI